ncbi:MAG: roadblock/LC7 domain-containing protein [Candidatus Heimdallarchaeota archaeon]
MSDYENYFENMFKKLLGIPGVKAVMIVSHKGLPIASALPKGHNEIITAAISASLFSTATRFVIEMQKGEFDQIIINGIEGYILIFPLGSNALLTISTTKDARLGLILSGNFGDYLKGFPFNRPPSPGAAGSTEKKGLHEQ